MSLAKVQRGVAGLVLCLTAGAALLCPPQVRAQTEGRVEDLMRKPRVKVAPAYPSIARRMSITGTVRLAVVVAPNGSVKSWTAVGGHPILVSAAMDAIRQWKFEPAGAESKEIVEFKFDLRD